MVEEESSEEMGKHKEEEVRGEGEATDLQLSLHAMWGIEGNYIMRINGSCQKKSMRILVDTGSTHNFLSPKMAEKLNYEWMTVKPAAVEVANGQQLEYNQKCKDFEWEMQGSKFWAEVHIIRLETYDLILGGQWLSTLGDIAWNFNTLQMKFEWNGSLVCISGEHWNLKDKQLSCLALVSQQEGGEEGQADEIKLSKIVTAREDGVVFAQTYGIQKEVLWPELQQLLTSFEDIFAEPTGLPPPRLHDHRIRLKEGATPINIRPYR